MKRRRPHDTPADPAPVALATVAPAIGVCGLHGGLREGLRADIRELARQMEHAQDRHEAALGHDLELIGQSVDDLVEECQSTKATAVEARELAVELRAMARRIQRDAVVTAAVLVAVLGAGWKALAWELEPPSSAVALAAHVVARHAAAHPTPMTTRP